MSEVPSTFQLKPGEAAPDFNLPDGVGVAHSLSDLLSGKKGLVVAFVCNHCPYVVHLAREFGQFANDAAEKGFQTVAISANDVINYPADSPERLIEFAAANGWDFPYLYDESQEVAKAYAAACTPDFYVFDADGKLTYAGQFDDTRPGDSGGVTGVNLRKAVDATLAGHSVEQPWYPATGCNIKWKAGNEPDYF